MEDHFCSDCSVTIQRLADVEACLAQLHAIAQDVYNEKDDQSSRHLARALMDAAKLLDL